LREQRDIERVRASERISVLESEREKLDLVLEREREQRERLEELQKQRQLENQIS